MKSWVELNSINKSEMMFLTKPTKFEGFILETYQRCKLIGIKTLHPDSEKSSDICHDYAMFLVYGGLNHGKEIIIDSCDIQDGLMMTQAEMDKLDKNGFISMKPGIVYVVSKSNNDTFLKGDHLWIDSNSPHIVSCVEAGGFLGIEELVDAINEEDNIVLNEALDWFVETNEKSSRAFKPTQEWIDRRKKFIEVNS